MRRHESPLSERAVELPNAEANLSAAVGERRIGTTLRHYDAKGDCWKVVGFLSRDGGATWRLTQEMPCRRRA